MALECFICVIFSFAAPPLSTYSREEWLYSFSSTTRFILCYNFNNLFVKLVHLSPHKPRIKARLAFDYSHSFRSQIGVEMSSSRAVG